MIVDLSTQDAHSCRETDVLVIGAGIAGLILANRLRGSNHRVVVLESGGREQIAETHPLNRVVQLGHAYSGATQGRFRCLGGTSTRWGGALIPFIEHDLAARPYLGLSGFPVGTEAISPYQSQVEKLFGLDGISYEEDFVKQIKATKQIPIGDCDFHARFAKWPIFKNRNLATLFEELIERDPKVEVWINSTAVRFDVDRECGRIKAVKASDGHDKYVTVTAKNVVICAGAIESTRLLLLLDREYNQQIFQGCNALGRFFYDHISLPMATIRAERVSKLNRLAAFRFVGSTMRSLRFELSPAAQEQERTGSAFGHISFRTDNSTGFDALRVLMRSLQRSGRIRPTLLLAALRDLPYLIKLSLWRARYNQLLWPVPATYELHVVVEQMPRASNSITLASEQDAFGLPLAAIRWQVIEDDRRTFSVFMRHFDSYWNRHGLRAIGGLDWTYNANSRPIDSSSHSDVYHPGGSTRMGTDRHSAVVDSDLRSFAIDNLFVASTSVFPSGGGANPTMTLMLFTMRLADHLVNKLGAGTTSTTTTQVLSTNSGVSRA
jgi:choline dehydrogenase-like flavoprotein